MKAPIEMMIDGLVWREVHSTLDHGDDLPFVTHEGTLELQGITLRVLQLSNGQRVIDSEDLDRLFGMML
jgi:hypothetical protein